MLTPEQKQALKDHVDKTWKTTACVLCGHSEWTADGVTPLLMLDTPTEAGGTRRTMNITGPADAVGSLMCTRCGNTVLVNLIVAGVLKP